MCLASSGPISQHRSSGSPRAARSWLAFRTISTGSPTRSPPSSRPRSRRAGFLLLPNFDGEAEHSYLEVHDGPVLRITRSHRRRTHRRLRGCGPGGQFQHLTIGSVSYPSSHRSGHPRQPFPETTPSASPMSAKVWPQNRTSTPTNHPKSPMSNSPRASRNHAGHLDERPTMTGKQPHLGH